MVLFKIFNKNKNIKNKNIALHSNMVLFKIYVRREIADMYVLTLHSNMVLFKMQDFLKPKMMKLQLYIPIWFYLKSCHIWKQYAL